MKQGAKLMIMDDKGQYLIMRRSGHPRFPNDPDLPGGTVEPGELPLDAAVREAAEEAGLVVDGERAELVYSGNEYSAHKTTYYLYLLKLTKRPEITISWEHASYKWLSLEDFLETARGAADTYMHMVYETMK